MLVVTRRRNEQVIFPDSNIRIQVVEIKGGKVRLGIEAPLEVTVLRAELRAEEGEPSSERMPKLPEPAQWVCWRNPGHAKCLWWDETYGPGPFEVVRVVEHTADELPHGIVLKTRQGDREINEVWLRLAQEPGKANVLPEPRADA